MAKDTTTDVEMKDESGATKQTPNDTEDAEPKVKKDPDLLTIEDIRDHSKFIEKAVQTKEPRYILRVMRSLVSTRRRLNNNVLRRLIGGFFPSSAELKSTLLGFLEEPMDAGDTPILPLRPKSARSQPLLPELEAYLHLLVLLHLLDGGKHERAATCSDLLMEKIVPQNRRTLDALAAKCYFYYARAYELTNQLDKIRSFLHARLRTATLRHDDEGTTVLLNLLLRNYLHYSTREPQAAFHQRINFCLDIHNQSVKAMRYPPKSYNKDLETAEERREREQQDLEMAKELAEEEDDDAF